MKKDGYISTLVNSKFYPLFLFIVSFVFVTLFSRSTSFLYVFEGADPSIFKQMGRALLKGKILYIDYFDNKGCLLYFIHAFGLWLGGDFIIVLMQTISLTITLIIWDKMLALYRNEKERIICIGIVLVMLMCFYGAGDQTQEWCLPFISYPLLIYFRAYKTKTQVTSRQMFFIGLCFGIITFIQINNACAFLGFVAYLWIQYIKNKDFKGLTQSIGCFFLGWLIIAIPCVLYFYIKAGWHGVFEMVYASLLSNLEYIGVQKHPKWFHWLPYILFLLSFIIMFIINSYRQRAVLISFLISIVLFVGTFGKLCSSFYFIALLPLFVVCLMKFSFQEHRIMNVVFGTTVLISTLFLGSIVIFHFVNDLILRNEKETAIYNNFHRCIEKIPETERDSIFNYNLFWHGYSMMEHEKLLQCNRVSILFDLPTLMREETSKMDYPPKWILMSWNRRIIKTDRLFIHYYYDLVDSFQYDMLYFTKPKIGKRFEVSLYRRKDQISAP
jgi:hypothetical protein